MSNAEVAQKLFICQETVKSHVRHILAKLEADNRTQAVAIALRESIIACGRRGRDPGRPGGTLDRRILAALPDVFRSGVPAPRRAGDRVRARDLGRPAGAGRRARPPGGGLAGLSDDLDGGRRPSSSPTRPRAGRRDAASCSSRTDDAGSPWPRPRAPAAGRAPADVDLPASPLTALGAATGRRATPSRSASPSACRPSLLAVMRGGAPLSPSSGRSCACSPTSRARAQNARLFTLAETLRVEAEERERERGRLSDRLLHVEEGERRRLALALHDGPQQSIAGIALMRPGGRRRDRGRRGRRRASLLAARSSAAARSVAARCAR